MTRRSQPQAKTPVSEPSVEVKDVEKKVVAPNSRFFCPVPSCAKNDQKSFNGWKAISSMISCVQRHCLHGEFESVPKTFWNERFFCPQCGTIVSNSHRGHHDRKCHCFEVRNEQASQFAQVIEPELDQKHSTESYIPTLEEVIEKNSRILKRIPRGARVSFARALIQLCREVEELNSVDAWTAYFLFAKCVLLPCNRYGKRHRAYYTEWTASRCEKWIGPSQATFLQKMEIRTRMWRVTDHKNTIKSI